MESVDELDMTVPAGEILIVKFGKLEAGGVAGNRPAGGTNGDGVMSPKF